MSTIAMESSNKESQVHNLYNKLIAGDLKSSKYKTEAQLEIERANVEVANQGVEELHAENQVIKKHIKRIKQFIDQKIEQIKN